jgi:hypothetical protein
MELRRAAESAESLGDGNGGAPTDTPAATKKEAKPKATKPRKSAKSKAPVRMRVRWAVVNDSLKQVAIFDYPQRSEAELKAADLIEKGKGHHFVRGVKEPMPEVSDPVAS